MKVKDLIARLQTFDQDLPVCLADWYEEWSKPSEGAAENVGVHEGLYNDKTAIVHGKVVVIG